MNQLKKLVLALATQYEGNARDASVWAAVALVTWGFAALRAWASSSDNGLTLAYGLGTDTLDPTYNVVSSAGLTLLLRFLLPIILKILLGSVAVMLVSLLATSASAHAAEIVGPAQIRAYSLGEYTAKISEAAAPLWFVAPRESASVKRVGNELILTGPPGRYTIDLAEITIAEGGKVPVASQITRTVEIVADIPPGPGPTPTPPGPGPTPPAPPDFLNLGQWAAAEAGKLSAADRAKAGEVAGILSSFGAAVAAGTLTPNDLLTQSAKELNARGSGWQAFRAALRAELQRLNFAKRPAGEFGQAWSAIAAGLTTIH